jgi:hypothetical protein
MIKVIDLRLKQSMSQKIVQYLTTGRTSRDKSIIDDLIFGIGHVLYYSPTTP